MSISQQPIDYTAIVSEEEENYRDPEVIIKQNEVKNLIKLQVLEMTSRVIVNQSFLLKVSVASQFKSKLIFVSLNCSAYQPKYMAHFETPESEFSLDTNESGILGFTLTFTEPGKYDLSKFRLQVFSPDLKTSKNTIVPAFLLKPPQFEIIVFPSLIDMIHLECKPVCKYKVGIKVEIDVENKHSTSITPLNLAIDRDAVCCGRNIRYWPKFAPSQKDKFFAIVNQTRFNIKLQSQCELGDFDQIIPIALPENIESERQYKPFRFLEPRALSADRIELKVRHDKTFVIPKNGFFHVSNQPQGYELTIYPQHSDVQAVKLSKVTGKLEIEHESRSANSWTFHIKITANLLMSETVRLFYEVKLPNRLLQAELHLCVEPDIKRQIQIAFALGFSITAQSGLKLISIFTIQEYDLTNFYEFPIYAFMNHPFDFFSLISILLFLVGIKLLDQINQKWLGA